MYHKVSRICKNPIPVHLTENWKMSSYLLIHVTGASPKLSLVPFLTLRHQLLWDCLFRSGSSFYGKCQKQDYSKPDLVLTRSLFAFCLFSFLILTLLWYRFVTDTKNSNPSGLYKSVQNLILIL